MNETRDYDDDLDGNYMACKPGDVAPGLEIVCTWGMPIIGSAAFLNGGYCFFFLYIMRCHRKLLARFARATAHDASNVQTLPKVGMTTSSYREKVLLSVGVALVSKSVMFLAYGHGTMYPTTHIRGQIGDVAAAILFAALWYLTLLQHRGAIYFKSLIPQPQASIFQTNRTKTWLHLPSLSTVLDTMQSWLAPVIALTLWGLLRTGVYTRAWFYLFGASLVGMCGLRSFISAVLQRSATVKRIVTMVNAKSGAREDKERRFGFLTKQFIILAYNLASAFFIFFLVPTSAIMLGSIFNSRQMAIHVVSMYVPIEVIASLGLFYSHFAFNKSPKKSGIRSKKKSAAFRSGVRVSPDVEVPKGMSLPPGASVVEQSDA